MAKFNWLKQPDQRTKEAKTWKKWFKGIAKLHERFLNEADFDPFTFNETASVSIFASSATQIGLLSLAEYVTYKKSKDDMRKKADGRADLWVKCTKTSKDWNFEFKVFWYGTSIKTEQIDKIMEVAHNDARHVKESESQRRFGVVIFSPNISIEGKDFDSYETEETLESYLTEYRDFSYITAAFAIKVSLNPIYCVIVEA